MSNKAIGYFLMFSLGAAVGTAVSWRILKTKYERIAQDEIDSVKEVFSKRLDETIGDEEIEIKEALQLNKDEYDQVFKKYSRESTDRESGEKGDVEVKTPYVIRPDEFGDTFEHELVTLTYYADGVLTDENDEIIEDVDGLVGKDAFNHFGECVYDPDTVYVRNHTTECDYEICRDENKYSEVFNA